MTPAVAGLLGVDKPPAIKERTTLYRAKRDGRNRVVADAA
jgi:hypothetical protein